MSKIIKNLLALNSSTPRGCCNLIELPGLPSSVANFRAGECKSLDAIIRDDIHTNCKWLSHVSIAGGINIIIGGDRVLESMFQGNATTESGCISLQLQGLETPKGFEPLG